MPCTPLNIFSNISVCPCSAARCLDDEAIDEKGVDSSEEIDFNVVPIMHEEEIGNFDEFDKNIQVTMKGGHNHQWTWCSVLSYFRI